MNNELTHQNFIHSYWNYFIELEEQFLATKRFVDFDKANRKTFSLEYLELIQAVCSEIDVVAKIIAEYFDPKFKSLKNINISKWGYVIQQSFPNFDKIEIRFNGDYNLIPWKKCGYEKYITKKGSTNYRLINGKESPKWWIAYNKVKHERTSNNKKGQMNYTLANLGNLISAMAALYTLETLFLQVLYKNNNYLSNSAYQKSKLFELATDER